MSNENKRQKEKKQCGLFSEVPDLEKADGMAITPPFRIIFSSFVCLSSPTFDDSGGGDKRTVGGENKAAHRPDGLWVRRWERGFDVLPRKIRRPDRSHQNKPYTYTIYKARRNKLRLAEWTGSVQGFGVEGCGWEFDLALRTVKVFRAHAFTAPRLTSH